MTTLAVIPARGGSSRIPRKNLRTLGDKPLIAWTIEAARQAKSVTQTVVTSDDDCILAQAVKYGANAIQRPHTLADGRVPSRDVVMHALDVWGDDPDRVMLLHPTSPFRSARHIDEASRLLDGWFGSVVSFTNDELNGAIYVTKANRFRRAGSFMRMPIRPYALEGVAGLDIDYPEQLRFARAYLQGEKAA